MSRAAHKPTDQSRAEVNALASFGTPQDEIARYIGIAPMTLRKHYDAELNLASIKANSTVGIYLFSLASGQAISKGATHSDCKAAAMFWAKTRMGWRETDRLEHSGPDGGAIPVKIERTIVDPKA